MRHHQDMSVGGLAKHRGQPVKCEQCDTWRGARHASKDARSQ
jgi:hypothetical protein